MIEVILRAGPLEGQRVKLSHKSRRYIERLDDKQVVYHATGESDLTTGLPKFTFERSTRKVLA